MYGNFKGLSSPTIDLTISDVDDLSSRQHKPQGKKKVTKKEYEEFVIPPKLSLSAVSDVESVVSDREIYIKKRPGPLSRTTGLVRKHDSSDDQSLLDDVTVETVTTHSPRKKSKLKPRARPGPLSRTTGLVRKHDSSDDQSLLDDVTVETVTTHSPRKKSKLKPQARKFLLHGKHIPLRTFVESVYFQNQCTAH